MKALRLVLLLALPLGLLGCSPPVVAQSAAQTITFNLVDVSGSKHYGYMEHVVFTAIDATHHTEDWTFLEPGNHPTRAHFDLHRVHPEAAAVRRNAG